MLIESEWPGATITARVPLADDREDEMFAGLDEGRRTPADFWPDQSHEDPDRCNLAKSSHRRSWIGMLTSILRQLRSRMHRRREIRRISAAWTMVDDWLLKDIGISRLEVEYARDARH
jgi:uncharacterized protein YjiS (DUF1127 family)